MVLLIVNNTAAFAVLKPMIPRHLGIVFIDFSVTLLPVKVFTVADPDPADDLPRRDFCFLLPVANIVDDFVADVMGNPLAD